MDIESAWPVITYFIGLGIGILIGVTKMGGNNE